MRGSTFYKVLISFAIVAAPVIAAPVVGTRTLPVEPSKAGYLVARTRWPEPYSSRFSWTEKLLDSLEDLSEADTTADVGAVIMEDDFLAPAHKAEVEEAAHVLYNAYHDAWKASQTASGNSRTDQNSEKNPFSERALETRGKKSFWDKTWVERFTDMTRNFDEYVYEDIQESLKAQKDQEARKAVEEASKVMAPVIAQAAVEAYERQEKEDESQKLQNITDDTTEVKKDFDDAYFWSSMTTP